MITRFDKLQTELPHPENPSPNSAAAVQELLGGKFGEMSTFMNYTFQSFNFRGRSRMRPFYDLIANIAAEEFGHIELVSYAINLLLTGTTDRGDDPSTAPLASAADARNSYHFLASGQQALPMDSQGNFWTGANVFSSGNLKLDLLHNFFLECGARASQDPGLRDGRRSDRPRVRRVPPGPRRGAHRGLCQGAREALGRGRRQAPPDSRHQQQALPGGGATRGPGASPHPLSVQPRGLPPCRRDLERPAPGGRKPRWKSRSAAPRARPPPDLEEEPQLTAPVGPDIDPEMFRDVAVRLFPEVAPKRKPAPRARTAKVRG